MGGFGFGQVLFAILFQKTWKTLDFCGFERCQEVAEMGRPQMPNRLLARHLAGLAVNHRRLAARNRLEGHQNLNLSGVTRSL
jgi:hypothetical protein